MKTLIISDEYRPVIGGIARVAGALADGLVQRGHDVTVLTSRARLSPSDHADEKATIRYYNRPKAAKLGKLYLTAVWPLSVGAWIRSQSFDRTFVLDPVNALPLPMMNLGGAVEYELLLHGSELLRYSRSAATRMLLGKAIAQAKQVFTTTRFVETQLLERYHQPSIRTSCGVGDEFFETAESPETTDRLRSRYGLASDDFIVGTISRLDFRKGNDIVVDAVAQLANRFPKLKYLIGGTGPQAEPLRRQVQRLQLSDRVVFCGRIADDELVAHYDLFDAYAMPNRLLDDNTVEGFGISFAEAAARGIPSIGVDNGGVAESVADGTSGILLPEATVDLVSRSLEQLLTGQAAFDRSLIQDHGHSFRWDLFIDRMLNPNTSRLIQAA